MALATFSSSPRSQAEFQQWSFAHAVHHRDINRLIYETYGVTLSEFVLDPFDPDDSEKWTWNHQQMHAEMNAILGIRGFNLNALDWRDETSRDEWISQNSEEHYQAGQILGLG